MRWLKELFRPKRKCERLGHLPYEQRRKGYAWPGKEYRSVADEVVQKRTRCARCHDILEDWEEVQRDGIQSLSMEEGRWDILKEDGYLWE